MNAPRVSIHSVAPDTYRIGIGAPPGLFPGFSSNLYLVVDERPLLFHTGPKQLFGRVRAQIETVLPVARLSYIAFSHVDAGECGALGDFLANRFGKAYRQPGDVAPEAPAQIAQVA